MAASAGCGAANETVGLGSVTAVPPITAALKKKALPAVASAEDNRLLPDGANANATSHLRCASAGAKKLLVRALTGGRRRQSGSVVVALGARLDARRAPPPQETRLSDGHFRRRHGAAPRRTFWSRKAGTRGLRPLLLRRFRLLSRARLRESRD